MQFFNKLKPLALLLLRAAIGVIFIYHGYPKLFGQAQRYVEFYTQAGLPGYFSYISGVLELFGGSLLIGGLFTRIAGLLLAVEMAVAIWKIHLNEGVLSVGEYQFPLAMAVGAFALAAHGAGLISLDYLIYREKA